MDIKTYALIGAIILAATTIDSASNNQFAEFKSVHSRTYSSETEEQYRLAVFNQNVAKINAHNTDETQTYKMGINQFTDMTQEGFESIILMPAYEAEEQEGRDDTSIPLVSNVDWVSQGGVSRMKDQGRCGSCWAFSAIGACESLKFVNTGVTGLFSDQEMNSCDTANGGCNGGFMWRAYPYSIRNGFCTEASYPYTSGNTGQTGSCQASGCTRDSFRITSFQQLSGTSSLQNANVGRPVAVAVDASNWSSYRSGIFSNCSNRLNHGVLLGGYTSSYWLVKNSWGSGWGESGYVRLASGNTCGIADEPTYPI